MGEVKSASMAVSEAAGAWPRGIEPTREFLAAKEFVNDGDGHLFVTGRAGTGKSTLLVALKGLLVDDAVVLAPTGLAAVNVVQGKRLTNIRAAGKDEALVLTPPLRLPLERALSYIEDDELVEVTPRSIRLRKRWLNPNERKKHERARAAS